MYPDEFRFTGNGKRGGSWNTVPKTVGRPARFFCDGAGMRYLSIMDNMMNVSRSSCDGRTTLQDFKNTYYMCERAFRAWLLEQPAQMTFDFVRDFGDYDARFLAMVLRYEKRAPEAHHRKPTPTPPTPKKDRTTWRKLD